MSSAIEVLKNWKSKMAKKVNIAFTQEEYTALGEAFLALEQKEELKEWLEKEISGKEMLKVHLKYQALEIIETEIKVLKEVLEMVGGQK